MKGPRKGFCLGLVLLFSIVLMGFSSANSLASDFPNRPITFIVQYAPGGGVDVTARILANIASKYAGVNIVVQNITGGGGTVGVTELAKANPDGYTLGLVFPTTLMESSVIEGVAYGSDSFQPICQINYDPVMMMVKANTEYDVTFDELVKMTKEKKLNMGVGALWTTFDLLKSYLRHYYDIDFKRIHYGSGGAAVAGAILAGDVDVGLMYPNEWISYYQSGELKGIGVASTERLKAFPDVPTFDEMGYEVGNIGVRRILIAPKGTPEEVMVRLEEIFMKALEDPRLAEEYAKVGMSFLPAGREEATANLFEEAQKFLDLIEELDIKPGDAPK